MRGAVGFNEMGDVMAEVVRISRDVGFHVARIEGFDPATDEVIVVKKDAARVWVEGMERSRFLHVSKPTWRGDSWTDSVDCEGIGGLLPCIGDKDCVEFVAVKTHRPPVAQEVAEPVAEAVPELSNEAKVKAVYPDASYSGAHGCVFSGSIQLSTGIWGKDMAWKYAALKLEAKNDPVSGAFFGCGVEVVSGAVLAN